MKIFSFVKKVFLLGLTVLSSITNALECVLIKNQECKGRPKTININSNNPTFYPFSVKINRCSGNFNNVNDPNARICVPDTIKNLNVKLFNLMSRTTKLDQQNGIEHVKIAISKDGTKINVDVNVKN